MSIRYRGGIRIFFRISGFDCISNHSRRILLKWAMYQIAANNQTLFIKNALKLFRKHPKLTRFLSKKMVWIIIIILGRISLLIRLSLPDFLSASPSEKIWAIFVKFSDWVKITTKRFSVFHTATGTQNGVHFSTYLPIECNTTVIHQFNSHQLKISHQMRIFSI